MKHRALEIEELTKQLVHTASVNGTEGERHMAEAVEAYLRSIPYFQTHKDQVIIQHLKNDSLDRRNVFAYIKGEKSPSNRTILLHGHMDTVGVEDYGPLEPYAFSCDTLLEKMRALSLPEDVARDLATDDWLVGRGCCDMKSGVAVFLVLLKDLSKETANFSGNILLSINPVEENLHTGIIEGLDILEVLKEKEHFEYLFAINNDYICPLYDGDPHKYIYTGSVSKLLPCFYIQGKETHVGQCFEGFDASMAASMLVERISLNPDFCEGYHGEFTLPPSVLKIKDLKNQYNVQTAFDALVYFNYFVHNETLEHIIAKLRTAAAEVFEQVLSNLNQQYERFCRLTGDTYKPYHYPVKIYTYEELITRVKTSLGEDALSFLASQTLKLEKEGIDKREIPLYLIRELLSLLNEKDPCMVLYFAAPYCPHNTLKNEIPEEAALFHELEEIIADFSNESGADSGMKKEEFKIMQFFPSLTDSSYLKIDDEESSIQTLISNFPSYDMLYPVPLKKIKKTNIPALNFGCYGKDCHKWSERVYKPYSFYTLPELIQKTLRHYLYS